MPAATHECRDFETLMFPRTYSEPEKIEKNLFMKAVSAEFRSASASLRGAPGRPTRLIGLVGDPN